MEAILSWRKSSYSGNGGGNCVEVAFADWHKSTHSGTNGGGCVEVARNDPDVVAVRDSKDPHGPALTLSPGSWRGFIADMKAGRHDLS